MIKILKKISFIEKSRFMFDKRISIFTGHFGSGKTEVALNYVFNLAATNKKTAIVDFDIVNPFFRTIDAKKQLEDSGIRLISSVYANTNVDVPAIPAEINSLFNQKEYKVVLDVGGDDLGAKALSAFKDDIVADDYEMYMVINLKRIMTDSEEKMLNMIDEIQESSRIKVTKLVNNTNLLHMSTGEEILEGQSVIESVSKKLGIPVGFTAGLQNAISNVKDKINSDVLYLNKHIKLPWD